MDATAAATRQSLGRSQLSLDDFAHLISPAAADLLEPMGQQSRQITQQRFGKVMRLFAPLHNVLHPFSLVNTMHQLG